MFVPILVLVAVFVLIAVRQVGGFKLEIWQVMLLGAVVVLLLGQISVVDAISAVNLDVMFFLFGMFVIGVALEESNYLSHISYRFFKNAKSAGSLLLFILFGFGFLSAILMNDTMAIIGTPVVLLLARKHVMDSKPLLLALAYAITIGSVVSPIGNPQNLLIVVYGGIENPFVTFFRYLVLPTVINLTIAYFLLRYCYKEQFSNANLKHSQEPIKDHNLATLSRISLLLLISLISIKILFVIFNINFDFKLTYIALFSMMPILLFSSKRLTIARKVDWHTLIFFVAMFVMMESVWQTGLFQQMIQESKVNLLSVHSILAVSVILSQLISNVPLAALYTPLLMHAGASTKELVALAAGSTIAGNLLVLGAASNVIIIQNAEKRGDKAINFFDFAKIGIPLTAVNVLVYWIFLQ